LPPPAACLAVPPLLPQRTQDCRLLLCVLFLHTRALNAAARAPLPAGRALMVLPLLPRCRARNAGLRLLPPCRSGSGLRWVTNTADCLPAPRFAADCLPRLLPPAIARGSATLYCRHRVACRLPRYRSSTLRFRSCLLRLPFCRYRLPASFSPFSVCVANTVSTTCVTVSAVFCLAASCRVASRVARERAPLPLPHCLAFCARLPFCGSFPCAACAPRVYLAVSAAVLPALRARYLAAGRYRSASACGFTAASAVAGFCLNCRFCRVSAVGLPLLDVPACHLHRFLPACCRFLRFSTRVAACLFFGFTVAAAYRLGFCRHRLDWFVAVRFLLPAPAFLPAWLPFCVSPACRRFIFTVSAVSSFFLPACTGCNRLERRSYLQIYRFLRAVAGTEPAGFTVAFPPLPAVLFCHTCRLHLPAYTAFTLNVARYLPLPAPAVPFPAACTCRRHLCCRSFPFCCWSAACRCHCRCTCRFMPPAVLADSAAVGTTGFTAPCLPPHRSFLTTT